MKKALAWLAALALLAAAAVLILRFKDSGLISGLLASLAAVLAAMGFKRKPNYDEIERKRREEIQNTPAADVVAARDAEARKRADDARRKARREAIDGLGDPSPGD